ncbi:hypothetical protein AVEN_151161-1 [Araneus ventricosus]|uniref:PiggyBac transposable element-derived protein domain-containing protein n=1 Tax=Araneus ventricosus TaxID=182803 RepID=A0A4Y2MSC7_ARAVE|nr:hypothetical protein AVEN_151161-1 [Araneus ventricosus]
MPRKYLTQMEIENVMKDLDSENYDDSDSDCEDELENSILEDNNEVDLDTSANFVEYVESLEEGGGLVTAGESSKSSDMFYSKASSSDKEEELISASASDSRDCKTVFSNGGRTAIGGS